MAIIGTSTLTLRFFGDDLDPGEITARLGCTPSHGVPKGGTIVARRGTERIARTGSWRLSARDRTPGDLDGQAAEVFDKSRDLDALIDYCDRLAEV